MNYLVTVYRGCEVVDQVRCHSLEQATAFEDSLSMEYDTDVKPLPLEYVRQRTPTPPA